MANHDVLIKKRNSSNTDWDNIYPVTLAKNVVESNGKNVETALAEKANKTEVQTAQSKANSAYTKAEEAFQSGVDKKNKMVEAVNSKKNISASTNDNWDTLVQKVKDIKQGQGNAQTSQVLSGKTFTNDGGNLLTGTMPNRSSGGYTTDSITHSGTELRFSIPDNAFYGDSAYIRASDADFIASNIRSGKNIFGVTGTVHEGKYNTSDYILASKLQKCFGIVKGINGPKGGASSMDIDKNGYIYIGTGMNICGSGKYCEVRKISPSGSQIWSFTGHTDVVSCVSVDDNGYVYSGSWDNTVRKISPSGSQIWSFTGHTDDMYCIIVDNNGYVYSGSGDYTTKKISPSGSQVWSISETTTSFFIKDQYLYFSKRNSSTIHKIPLNGGEKQFVGSCSGSNLSSIAIDNNGCYYGAAFNGGISKLSSTGKIIWNYTEVGNCNNLAVDSNDYIYSDSDTNNGILKISSDGNKVWEESNIHDSYGEISCIIVDDYGYIYTSHKGMEWYTYAVSKIQDRYKILK